LINPIKKADTTARGIGLFVILVSTPVGALTPSPCFSLILD